MAEGSLSGIYLPILRNWRRQAVPIEEVTERELERYEGEHPEMGWHWAKALIARLKDTRSRVEPPPSYEHYVRLLSCVTAVYKKRLAGDPQMSWEALDSLMAQTLDATLGTERFRAWCAREVTTLRQEAPPC